MAVEWTRVRHEETKAEAIMSLESLEAQRARGWEPFGETTTDRLALVRQRDEEDAAEAEAAKVRVAEAAGAAEAGVKRDDVLEAVGDDPVAAQAALDAELAKPSKDQRVTLLDSLRKIIDRPDTATTEKE